MRDWTDPCLKWWPRDSERTNWHATLNNIEIGGYSTKPSEHWTGVYCWFGNTKFVPFPESEEQARAWIESKLKEWLIEAVAVMRPSPPNAGTQRPGTSDAEPATRPPMPGSLK